MTRTALALVALLAAAAAQARAAGETAGRSAHWVLRVTDLERSLAFYSAVFGMRVIRHEEHAAACPITCNGAYATPWSKTMVGYDYEDASYCLELTYNYGVHEYARGGGLREIAIAVPDPAAAAAAARAAGYARSSRPTSWCRG